MASNAGQAEFQLISDTRHRFPTALNLSPLPLSPAGV